MMCLLSTASACFQAARRPHWGREDFKSSLLYLPYKVLFDLSETPEKGIAFGFAKNFVLRKKKCSKTP